MRTIIFAAAIAALSATAEAQTIARRGEWVTDPRTGAPICQLRVDLWWGTTLPLDLCESWTGRQPLPYEAVPWVRIRPGGLGRQIHVEGQWRP